MTDYASWKVTDLKAELKKRGIPQTGLRLKQHFIEKLTEEDAKASTDDAAAPSAEPIDAENAQQEITEELNPPAETPNEQKPEEQQPEQQPAQSKEESPQQEPAETKGQSPPAEQPQQKESQEKAIETEQTDEGKEGDGDAPSTEKVEEAKAASPVPFDVLDKSKVVESDSVEASKGAGEDSVQPVEQLGLTVAQTSEANTELSTPLPVEEALEDKRKRKRRSQSPVPTPEAIAAKKARAEEEGPQIAPVDSEMRIQEETQETQGEQKATDSALQASASKPPAPPKQDARFRGLFASTDSAPARPSSPPQDVVMEDADVEPAQHAATASLYIDGLMRPLQPPALRNHLAQLASGPGGPATPEVIQEYYLDPIKTHCFVRFRDVPAAARVRNSIHGKTWPNERNRKNLWADFIPDERIQEWIQTEEASRDRAGPPVRWEVQYKTTDDTTTAILCEAGSKSRTAPTQPHQAGTDRAPLGPRGSFSQADRQPPSAPPAAPSRPGQGFKPLDELFKSTTAKPKLYYLPVARDIADKRLDQFDELLRKGSFPRRGGDEMRRITFEEEDEFVDIGPEYGRAAAQRRQERGGGRGGRRNWRGR